MEGLILMIIIGLISSFFGKMGSDEKKSMPPFGDPNQRRTSQPIDQPKKTFEDFTKEIFNQFDEYLDDKPKPVTSKKNHENREIKHVKPLVETQVTVKKETPKPETKVFNTARNVQKEKTISSSDVNNTKQERLPNFTSKDVLVQSIITSEILGPPMAKRR